MNNDDDIIINALTNLLTRSRVKSIKISLAKKKFFEHLTIKNVAEDTVQYYKNLFYFLDKYFMENRIVETEQIDDQLLRSIITSLLALGKKPEYINKIIKAIKYIMKILAEQDLISYYYFRTPILKTTEKPFDSFTQEQLDVILDYAKNLDLKHYLMVLILASTGVRRTELCKIQVKNIDFEDNSILLEDTKTKNIRFVIIPQDVADLVKQYLEQSTVTKYLFETKPGKHLEPHSISTFLDRMKKSLNFSALSAHMFRHTFATMIYESSGDLEIIRQLLGHKDYSMTKRYLHQSKKNLKDKYLKYSPIKTLKK